MHDRSVDGRCQRFAEWSWRETTWPACSLRGGAGQARSTMRPAPCRETVEFLDLAAGLVGKLLQRYVGHRGTTARGDRVLVVVRQSSRQSVGMRETITNTTEQRDKGALVFAARCDGLR